MLSVLKPYLSQEVFDLVSPFYTYNEETHISSIKTPDFSCIFNLATGRVRKLKISRKLISYDLDIYQYKDLKISNIYALLNIYIPVRSRPLEKNSEELAEIIGSEVSKINCYGTIHNIIYLTDCISIFCKQNLWRWATKCVVDYDPIRDMYYDHRLNRIDYVTTKISTASPTDYELGPGGVPNEKSNRMFLLPPIFPHGVKAINVSSLGFVEDDRKGFAKLVRNPYTGFLEKKFVEKVTKGNTSDFVPLWYFDTYTKVGEDCGHLDYNKEVQQGLCKVCLSRLSKSGTLLNPYGTKVPRYISSKTEGMVSGKFEKDGNLYGIELELENGREAATIPLYKKFGDYLLCKTDGSLTNGIEIVTCPATYEVHKEKGKLLFETITKETKLINHINCGLHIHVSRSSLSSFQIGKIVEFIHNPKNKEFIFNISGRTENSYSSLKKERKITDLAPENFNYDSEERHIGVNLQNKDTIEFRIFASTTIYEEYMTRFDFVRALLAYTKSCQVNVKSLSQLKDKETFISFLSNEKKEYPYLTTFLGLRKVYDPNQQKGTR